MAEWWKNEFMGTIQYFLLEGLLTTIIPIFIVWLSYKLLVKVGYLIVEGHFWKGIMKVRRKN
jgi:hypothetical protein